MHCTTCQANSAGISLAPDASFCAPQTAGCTTNAQCGTNAYCDFGASSPGSCANGGAIGACAKRPESCTEECASPKLCGCDGQEYCNACSANGAGTSISADTSLCAP